MTGSLLIVGREGLAEFLGGSLDLVRKLRATPGFPKPLDVPGRICWARCDLEAWVERVAPRSENSVDSSRDHRSAEPVKHRRSKHDRPLSVVRLDTG